MKKRVKVDRPNYEVVDVCDLCGKPEPPNHEDDLIPVAVPQVIYDPVQRAANYGNVEGHMHRDCLRQSNNFLRSALGLIQTDVEGLALL